MLTKKKAAAVLGGIFLTFLFLMQPSHAQAARGSGWKESRHPSYFGHHPSPVYGRIVVGSPRGFVSFVIRGSRYYYRDGSYYRHVNREYVIVAPPKGPLFKRFHGDPRSLF